MKVKNADWYKTIWSLDIKNQSWVEDTDPPFTERKQAPKRCS
ncbi:hypothetical protein [Clostridium sp. E02]|nr:hypothetical protein [Clostridium sp. E02]